MNEEKTTENTEAQEPSGNNEEGSKPETLTLVDRANAAAERMEKANQRTAELIRQQEELEAKRALGGISEGPSQKETPKEETPKDYIDKVMRGEVSYTG